MPPQHLQCFYFFNFTRDHLNTSLFTSSPQSCSDNNVLLSIRGLLLQENERFAEALHYYKLAIGSRPTLACKQSLILLIIHYKGSLQRFIGGGISKEQNLSYYSVMAGPLFGLISCKLTFSCIACVLTFNSKECFQTAWLARGPIIQKNDNVQSHT